MRSTTLFYLCWLVILGLAFGMVLIAISLLGIQ